MQSSVWIIWEVFTDVSRILTRCLINFQINVTYRYIQSNKHNVKKTILNHTTFTRSILFLCGLFEIISCLLFNDKLQSARMISVFSVKQSWHLLVSFLYGVAKDAIYIYVSLWISWDWSKILLYAPTGVLRIIRT